MSSIPRTVECSFRTATRSTQRIRPAFAASCRCLASLNNPAADTQRRTFFSLPDLTKIASLVPGQGQEDNSENARAQGVEVDGEVQRFHARKILPYSQVQLYSLVSDVPSYASFIPFCKSSTVLAPSSPGVSSTREWVGWKPEDKPFEVLAELAVGFGGLEERYVSKVVGKPYESVVATASNQTPMFKTLTTSWTFSAASSISPHPSFGNPSSNSSNSRIPNSATPADPTHGPSLLTIDLAFSFINPLHRIASQAVLPKVAEKMVEAFEERCLEVWGQGKQ
ncbi:hypothetical protein LQV05_005073 [Cryptococcus neoformans]|nr:hypothetical protein J007_03274 [Cryptococcus neoformans var. grubii]OXC61195.1 hypothetical protein C358_03364 [Cryptococcus neoformans var. grubii MW-RSA852]UOH82373.1 hypothetical protein LQV05_005073 [Cryptococcus neoformans]